MLSIDLSKHCTYTIFISPCRLQAIPRIEIGLQKSRQCLPFTLGKLHADFKLQVQLSQLPLFFFDPYLSFGETLGFLLAVIIRLYIFWVFALQLRVHAMPELRKFLYYTCKTDGIWSWNGHQGRQLLTRVSGLKWCRSSLSMETEIKNKKE